MSRCALGLTTPPVPGKFVIKPKDSNRRGRTPEARATSPINRSRSGSAWSSWSLALDFSKSLFLSLEKSLQPGAKQIERLAIKTARRDSFGAWAC